MTVALAEVADLPRADEAAYLIDCPACGGGGEIGVEPLDWWHGSGVNVRLYPCHECDGTGAVTLPPAGAEGALRPIPEQEF